MDKLAQIPIGERFLGSGGFLTQLTDIGGLVTIIVRVVFAVAGLVLVFYIISGGIGMIAGAGSDNPERTSRARQALTTAAIGFVVVFSAYWIVRLIELITGLTLLG